MTQIRSEYRRRGNCRICGGPTVQEVVIIPSWDGDLERPGKVLCETDPTHSQER